MKTKTVSLLFTLVLGLLASSASAKSQSESVYVPPFLAGSVFEQAALRSQIDALLLYSIALAESASYKGGGNAGPSPLAIRAGADAFYPKSLDEAEAILKRLIGEGRTNIDVGLMQINLRWHGHRVSTPYELFDPAKNLGVASSILYETLVSSPRDIRRAIGRYHNWEDHKGGPYADRVLAMYKALKP